MGVQCKVKIYSGIRAVFTAERTVVSGDDSARISWFGFRLLRGYSTTGWILKDHVI